MVLTRWVRDTSKKYEDWKKQYYMKGEWHDKKKHALRWKRIPFFIFSIIDIDRDRDLGAIVAALRMCAIRIFNLVPVDRYVSYIKELMVGEDMEKLRAAWKESTMNIIRAAIAEFPFPVPEFQQVATDLAMFIADKFYDFMFSL